MLIINKNSNKKRRGPSRQEQIKTYLVIINEEENLIAVREVVASHHHAGNVKFIELGNVQSFRTKGISYFQGKWREITGKIKP